MGLIRLFFLTIVLMLMVACGGGGSSSDSSSGGDTGGGTTDGGTDPDPGPDPDPNDFSGVYNGSQSLVLSMGAISETANIDANVTVTGNAILIDPLSANGSISSGSFVATTNRTSTQNGLTCQFLLTYRGTISRESLSGDITGTAICNQSGGSQTLNVTGTVSANRS